MMMMMLIIIVIIKITLSILSNYESNNNYINNNNNINSNVYVNSKHKNYEQLTNNDDNNSNNNSDKMLVAMVPKWRAPAAMSVFILFSFTCGRSTFHSIERKLQSTLDEERSLIRYMCLLLFIITQ